MAAASSITAEREISDAGYGRRLVQWKGALATNQATSVPVQWKPLHHPTPRRALLPLGQSWVSSTQRSALPWHGTQPCCPVLLSVRLPCCVQRTEPGRGSLPLPAGLPWSSMPLPSLSVVLRITESQSLRNRESRQWTTVDNGLNCVVLGVKLQRPRLRRRMRGSLFAPCQGTLTSRRTPTMTPSTSNPVLLQCLMESETVSTVSLLENGAAGRWALKPTKLLLHNKQTRQYPMRFLRRCDATGRPSARRYLRPSWNTKTRRFSDNIVFRCLRMPRPLRNFPLVFGCFRQVRQPCPMRQTAFQWHPKDTNPRMPSTQMGDIGSASVQIIEAKKSLAPYADSAGKWLSSRLALYYS
ncbi:hypothetical protein CCHR01_18804 [Colletotrichum chrysophilum]|uniref:Uncharacterized protein n=1 Tax=Colletotrichum chrysophilum TaxID=1836956 RepID=A0AAD9E8J1_9PEZI|nr:hypothetical protein CCHR01_18804 [Colletotrichum chrysophilum]